MKSIQFNIPNSWNALTDKQLIKVSLVFFYNQNVKTIDYKLFKIFCKYKWYKFKLFRKIRLLFKTRQVSEIKKAFRFIYEKQDLTRFIPIVTINRKKYYAPADRLNNLSIGEFSVCEDLYLGYLRTATDKESNFGESYLRYLFAVLYISTKSKVRPDFNKEIIETVVEKTSKLPKKLLFATLLSYKGCREAITSNKKYKHIFPDNKSEEISELKIPASSGFSDVILSFSGKLFGEYHKTYNTNVYTFLDAYEKALETLEKAPK